MQLRYGLYRPRRGIAWDVKQEGTSYEEIRVSRSRAGCAWRRCLGGGHGGQGAVSRSTPGVVEGGYSVGTDDFNQTLVVVPAAPGLLFTSSAPNTIAPKGGFFGGQVGFNWQTGPVVFGVEGDFMTEG